ncbi:MAG: LysR family transcriptional regulator substrate-binding protein [Alphaproteobacteria bacterium]
MPQATLLEDMRLGTLELALLTDCPRIDARYRTDVLFEDGYVVAMPPDHPLSARDTISLRDLHGQDYVNRLHCEKNAEIEALLGECGASVMTHLVSDQDEFVRRMIKAGLGISIMPEPLAGDGLTARPLADPPIARRVVLASLASRQISGLAEIIRNQIISDVENAA